MLIITTCLWTAAACWLLFRAITRWRDQPTSRTIAFLAGAWAMLIVPVFAVTESEGVLLAMFVVPILGFTSWGLGVELMGRSERSLTRENATAAGMDPDQAKRLFRRQPRHPILVMLIYAGVAMLFVFACVGVDLLLGLNPEEPSIRLNSGEGEPPYDMPWWIATMGVIATIGMVHALVNAIRREIPRDR